MVEGGKLPACLRDHFDTILRIHPAANAGRYSETREKLWNQLDRFLGTLEKSASKVLLLVDDTQLLRRNDPGLYVAIRWWLRQSDVKLLAVAVFVGTLLSLASYQIPRQIGPLTDPSELRERFPRRMRY